MGCVHIYCGDGKGKTSAALGLSLRAAGRGLPVVIARFLKTDNSGEVGPLAALPGVQLLPCERSFGFFKNMTEEEKREAKGYYRELLEKAWETAADLCGEGRPVLLILDEIAAACAFGFVSVLRLSELLDGRPEELEVVLTGRNPDPELLSRADYISEIQKVKHPFDRGLAAREGIEY